jgi:rare lipoprotein A
MIRVDYSCVTPTGKEFGRISLLLAPANNIEDLNVHKYILPGLLCLGACSTPPTANNTPVQPAKNQFTQVDGRASYYGGRRNGRATSSGEILNSSRMTAAHRTLPFGTKVMVTNLWNGHACDVEINDRGPALWTGRVLDVSVAAARCLDMFGPGVIPVRMEIPG